MARSSKTATPTPEPQTNSPTEAPSPTEDKQVEVIDIAVDESQGQSALMPEVTVDDKGVIQIS